MTPPSQGRSNYTWFDAPGRDKHDGIKIVALPSKWKIVSSKNRFGKFGILTPVDLNFDLSQKWLIWFLNDFSRAFERRFRFVLRCAGAEIDGGVQTPPQQVVENPEAQKGRG